RSSVGYAVLLATLLLAPQGASAGGRGWKIRVARIVPWSLTARTARARNQKRRADNKLAEATARREAAEQRVRELEVEIPAATQTMEEARHRLGKVEAAHGASSPEYEQANVRYIESKRALEALDGEKRTLTWFAPRDNTLKGALGWAREDESS